MSSPDGRVYSWSRGGVDAPIAPAGRGMQQLHSISSASTLERVIFYWHLWQNDLDNYFLDDFQRIVSALVYVEGNPPVAPLPVGDSSFHEQDFLHLSHHLAGMLYPISTADVHGIVPRDAPGLIDVSVRRRPSSPNSGQVWWVWGQTEFSVGDWIYGWTRSVLTSMPATP